MYYTDYKQAEAVHSVEQAGDTMSAGKGTLLLISLLWINRVADIQAVFDILGAGILVCCKFGLRVKVLIASPQYLHSTAPIAIGAPHCGQLFCAMINLPKSIYYCCLLPLTWLE